MNVKKDDDIHGWHYRDAILAKYKACKSASKTADSIAARMGVSLCSSQVLKIIRKMGEEVNKPLTIKSCWRDRPVKKAKR